MKDRDPVFVHSMFRSGSTYIFSVFRRAGEFYCFQESVHEFAFLERNNPGALTAGIKPSADLRHPKLDDFYFAELAAISPAWRDTISEPIIYADAFPEAGQDATISYFNSLIAASPRRPVFQECRTAFRITPLRKALGGTHIALWRNPWDQWWSYKATDYFDVANLLFLNASKRPAVIDRLRTSIGFEPCPVQGIPEQFAFYNDRRLSAESSYRAFFTLWCLAALQAQLSAHVDISIDALSTDDAYQQKITAALAAHEITGLDFSDCQIPRMSFSAADASFFEAAETDVFALFESEGLPATKLKMLQKRARSHRILSGSDRSESANLRRISIRLEDRSAVFASRWVGSNENATAALARVEKLREDLANSNLLERQARELVDAKASEIGLLRAHIDEKAAEVGLLEATLEDKAHALGAAEIELDSKASEIGGLRAELDNKASEIGGLRAELDNKASEVGGLRAELDSKASEIGLMQVSLGEKTVRLDALQAALEQAETERQQLKIALEDAQAAQRALGSELAAVQQAARLAADRLNVAEHAISVLESERAADAEVMTNQRSAIADLQREQARLVAHIAWQDARLEEVWRSASWRLTEPLRVLRRWVHVASAPLVHRARTLARQGATRGLHLVRNQPGLKGPVLAVLDVAPPLKQRLLRFAAQGRPAEIHPAIVEAAPMSEARAVPPWSGSLDDDVAIALEVLQQSAARSAAGG